MSLLTAPRLCQLLDRLDALSGVDGPFRTKLTVPASKTTFPAEQMVMKTTTFTIAVMCGLVLLAVAALIPAPGPGSASMPAAVSFNRPDLHASSIASDYTLLIPNRAAADSGREAGRV